MKKISDQIQYYLDVTSCQNVSELRVKCEKAANLIFKSLNSGMSIFIFGNGESAADSQHIAGEFLGKFLKDGKVLNVRVLTVDTTMFLAWANDVNFETVFSRQIEAYGKRGGVLYWQLPWFKG
jgi:D-sedoheptulose 7-phosphate isomerase